MTTRWKKALIALAAVGVLKATLFSVDETESVIVTQFGRPVRTISGAGLHAKCPWQNRRKFDRRLQTYNPRPSEFLTRDRKNLLVDNYVCWRIKNPNRFLQTVTDTTGAEMRLHDVVWAEVSATIGQFEMSDLISVEQQKVHVNDVMGEVTRNCRKTAELNYGIEVVDVRIKRLNLPEQNKQSVFKRMRAERERMAKQYRAEGEEEATKIRAEADKERDKILSEAYREAEKTRGRGDAEAARTYAAAYGKDPAFFKMLRTLESYKKVLTKDTTVILSSDSELLRLLTQGREGKSE